MFVYLQNVSRGYSSGFISYKKMEKQQLSLHADVKLVWRSFLLVIGQFKQLPG